MTKPIVLPQGALAMPPPAPLSTPTQDLRALLDARRLPTPFRVTVARVIAFGGAGLVTAAGGYEMVQVVSSGGITVLEAIMGLIFTLTFAWIAFAATSALAGVLVGPPPRNRAGLTEPLASRTALVMPIYHEDPADVAAGLGVMARALAAKGQAHAFEIVMLSDSASAEAWVAETAAVDELRRLLTGIMPVWYRRRWSNRARKAGNIRDFVERWGARYEHFVILDADSLMAPSTLIALAATMESEPDIGILQTAPTLAGGRTLFARLQQFASRVYGPVIARGVAAWQGGEGNYWGHNAIIRTAAFASACGLPDLPGREPLGGPILSHDFVEAALMRRAGWRVEMAADLQGSWEESPPSLVESAARDRRWAQGNLQHIRVLAARGLTWPSRVHLLIGIMSYLVSPLWLLLILFGFALSAQALLVRPEYFPEGFQLFPTWPLFDSERMLRLFLLTLGVLFFPKLLGLATALASRRVRRGCGGPVRLIASVALETVLSALYAPITMAIHSRQIYEILLGRDSGWAPQHRTAQETPWPEAFRRHAWHTATGVFTGISAWLLSPMILAWLSPTIAGLLLAVPLSRLSGSISAGSRLRRAGLLLTPEESAPHPIIVKHRQALTERIELPADGVVALAMNPAVRDAHYRWASPAPRQRGAPDAAYLTASQKIAEADSLQEALSWLDPVERVHVAGQPGLLDALMRLAQPAAPVSGVQALPPERELGAAAS